MLQIRDGRTHALALGMCVCAVLGSAASARAQTVASGIDGVVKDATTGETIIEGAVQVVGRRRVFTDYDGNFSVDLPPGTYTLRVTYDLYQTARVSDVVVQRGQRTTIDVELTPDTDTLAEVVVTARADRATEATQLELRRQSASVSDGISAQEIARSPDSNAGDAARRVVGASVVNGQYLFVRGLGGRYTSVLLNGAQIPSTDPDVPGVQLDLFPASVLAAMTIYKTVVPDVPADAAGGTLMLTTREFPADFHLGTNLSLGYNSQTTFRDVLGYEGGGTDALGFDDGTRALPSTVPGGQRLAAEGGGLTQEEVNTRARGFGGSWALGRSVALPNLKLGINLGDSISFGTRRLGYFLTVGYQHELQRTTEAINRVHVTGTGPFVPVLNSDRLSRETTQESALLGALGALSLELSDDDTLGLTVLASQAGDDYAGFTTGYSEEADKDVYVRRLRWVQRSLLFGQLSGDHQHLLRSATRLKWQVNGALGGRNEPDTRDLRYEQQPRGPAWVPGAGSGERIFNALSQRDVGGSFDLTIPVGGASTRFGTFGRLGDRAFDMRRFKYDRLAASFETLPPDQLFASDNIGIATLLEENTQATDSYRATQALTAAYGMVDWPLADWLRVIGGVRVEGFRQTVDAQSPFADASTMQGVSRARTDVDPLPSASVVLQPIESMFVRLAYGRAVARPQIRELAPFVYPDFVRRRNVSGNPDLQRALIDNVDLRWEWFPAPSEVLAVSGFYKNFQQAIESVIYDENGSTTFQNVQGVSNLGLEVEAKLSLGRLTRALRSFSIAGNVSIIESSVELSPEQQRQATSAERPMAGQSPYVANLSLGFAPTDSGIDLRLYYNVFGRRLVDVGRNNVPDVYQVPFHSLDIACTWEVGEHLKLKAAVSNILNDDYVLEQGGFVIQAYDQGVSASVGLGYEI